jgi:preprotein translocase SecE subunit
MKKKKARRKKGGKRPHVALSKSLPKQEKASEAAIAEREDLQLTPPKRDVYKRADNGGFAPKRYFIVARQFLVDAKVELKKVTWPTKKELLSTTAVVLVLVFLIAFFLGIVDLGLVKIIRNVIG